MASLTNEDIIIETHEDIEEPRKSQLEIQAHFEEHKGRYQGDIDPKTKLRQGKGTYTYTNTYFQYQGEWNGGKKHGQGSLLMKDGSTYTGNFVNGEISGKGTRTWECGMHYEGDWH